MKTGFSLLHYATRARLFALVGSGFLDRSEHGVDPPHAMKQHAALTHTSNVS
jgi:hypothetical protein